MWKKIFASAIIHGWRRFVNEKVGVRFFIKFTSIVFALTVIPTYGGDWLSIGYGENSNFIYDTSLIEKSGIFSNNYIVWLKIKRLENEISCGAKPHDSQLQEGGQVVARALSQNVANYSYCMQRAMQVPMEEVHKVSLECKTKNISHVTYESTNSRGESVLPTYKIGSHPGSLGYTVMSLYCGD